MTHYKYSQNCPTFCSVFTFADSRKINKVLSIMEEFAENDCFFAGALEELKSSNGAEKIGMFKHVLEIFNSADGNFVDLEQAVFLAAYE